MNIHWYQDKNVIIQASKVQKDKNHMIQIPKVQI